jgi:hypothetical protein
MPKKPLVYLVANGDLRLSANQTCEAAQAAMERQIINAVASFGHRVQRAHSFDKSKQHGFIDSQKMGIAVFQTIPKEAPLIVAEAVWQYSQQILPGLIAHQGPILTIANWSGQWPGLVGLLNLNASLTKAGVAYSSAWSETFNDAFFRAALQKWLDKGSVKHPTPQVKPYALPARGTKAEQAGVAIARELKQQQAILGIFDEGCMGMYNAIVPDELLAPLGLFKERLSQSTLYARMRGISETEARTIYQWLTKKGLTFRLGKKHATELTEAQVLDQCRMYIAAVRLADEFGAAAIGIQYQQGLKDLAPASDLVEGLLNNNDRPPVQHAETGKVLFPNRALPHFNEVDECAGIDGLVTHRLWEKLGWASENTLHDLRWGANYHGVAKTATGVREIDAFIWVLLISGAAPPAHFVGGYKGATSERQPPMYFAQGGGTLKGESKAGWMVWSRIFVADGKLNADVGVGEAVELPAAETQARWDATTPQWPIMNAIIHGVTRDQMMARHKSNHIQVVYCPDAAAAKNGMLAKAAAFAEMGMRVSICGGAEA